MKTIMTALVALAFNYSASANHLHTGDCKVNCPVDTKIAAPASKSYEQKLAEIKLASEDKLSYLNYNQTMQRTLNLVALQKHQNAIANIEAENAYNKMMVTILGNLEQQKVADQIEDMAAGQRFETLMSNLLSQTAGL